MTGVVIEVIGWHVADFAGYMVSAAQEHQFFRLALAHRQRNAVFLCTDQGIGLVVMKLAPVNFVRPPLLVYVGIAASHCVGSKWLHQWYE